MFAVSDPVLHISIMSEHDSVKEIADGISGPVQRRGVLLPSLKTLSHVSSDRNCLKQMAYGNWTRLLEECSKAGGVIWGEKQDLPERLLKELKTEQYWKAREEREGEEMECLGRVLMAEESIVQNMCSKVGRRDEGSEKSVETPINGLKRHWLDIIETISCPEPEESKGMTGEELRSVLGKSFYSEPPLHWSAQKVRRVI